MEEVLKQILGELKALNSRVGGLEEGQRSLEEGQRKLEEGQEKIVQRLDSMEGRLDRIEGKADAVFDQVGGLLEFRTETLLRLVGILAGEMGKQKLEIELLKKRPV